MKWGVECHVTSAQNDGIQENCIADREEAGHLGINNLFLFLGIEI